MKTDIDYAVRSLHQVVMERDAAISEVQIASIFNVNVL
jgi:hypothetical protein